MDKPLRIEIGPEEIIAAVNRTKKKERDAFLEDLLAAASPDYLRSIEDARNDYRVGRTKTHLEVFH